MAVQDPADALYPNMPRAAMHAAEPDVQAPADGLAAGIVRLCATSAPEVLAAPSVLMQVESRMAMMDRDAMNAPDRPGRPAGYSCPDCAGTLFEIIDGDLVRYRCRVGHAWSAEALLVEQAQALEAALWMGLRSLEEKASLARELGDRADRRGNPLTAARFAEQAQEATSAASLIRSVLEADLPAATGVKSDGPGDDRQGVRAGGGGEQHA